MRLAVLGSMEVVSGAGRVPLGGPKQRLVLGLLAASRSRVVTLDELVDGLWPTGPEARQPRKTVQVYVTRLRRAFGASAAAIRSEAAGYRLDTGVIAVDADEFEAELGAAGVALDDDVAITRLRAALGRWRGDAFVDLRDCPAIVASAVRLDELRLTAMHEMFEREIRRRPRAVISELEQAVKVHPLHEGFAAQLMTAQYRAGRQADALVTYQALCRRLGEELGLEPGTAVRELQGRIVRHELAVVPIVAGATERQRRRVTVLAVEIAVESCDGAGLGVPLDPEEELAAAAHVRQAARSQILQGGGVVLADVGDGLTACFGYPVRGRSVELAVQAGLAIRDVCDSSNVAGGRRVVVRIGIDTGVVVVEAGSEGGSLVELVGVVGEPLRSATYLRQRAAPGEVLVGSETAAAVSGTIELEPAAEGMLVVAARDGAGGGDALPGLIGRDVAALELGALTAGCEHRLCAVVVNGPPGIGKSALVERFLAGLGGSQPVTRVYCDRRHSVTPLHPFRHVLGELFDSSGDPTARTVIAALGARWPVMPVLVVEDVDAADPSTIEVLAGVCERWAVGLLMLTSRSIEPLDLGGDIVPAVSLGPLDRAASRRLAVSIAGDRRLQLDTLNEIADRSGGVPLYIAALTRAAVDDTGGQAGGVPTSLYDSLMADLDRLGPARATVQRCSVLGTVFTDADFDLIDRHEPTSSMSRAHLVVAVDRGVLLVEGEGRYRFSHELIAGAAYESLLRSERAALHAGVADGLPDATARAEPERLAFHLESAGRLFDAAVAWRRASAKAIGVNRHAEAQQHARRSLRLLDALSTDDLPDGGDNRRRALVNLAFALQATSCGSPELFDVIEQLRAGELEATDPARAFVVRLLDISNRQAAGDFAGAERVARENLAAAQRLDEASVTFARHFLGATLVFRGELAEGTAELETASKFWDRGEAPPATATRTLGAHWSMLGLAAFLQGCADDAADLLDRARATITAEDGYGRCLVAWMQGTVDQLAGHPDLVRATVEPVWSLAMDLSTDFWMRWAQMLLGWSIVGERSEPATLNGLAMMAEVVDDKNVVRQAAPYFAYLLGSRLGEHGRHREGLSRLDAGLAVATETGENLWDPLLHLARAQCLGGAGDPVAAVAAVDTASSLASAMGATMVVGQCNQWRATVS